MLHSSVTYSAKVKAVKGIRYVHCLSVPAVRSDKRTFSSDTTRIKPALQALTVESPLSG